MGNCKRCACCKRLLDISCFTTNKRNKDGLHSYCKECNKIKAQEYNRLRGKEYTKKYRHNQINSGYFRYGHGAFANMKKSSAKRNIPFLLSEESLKTWWINTEDICHYCGASVEEYRKIRDFVKNYDGNNVTIVYIKEHVFNKQFYWNIDTLTIDRVDSNGPYDLNNIVKSCWICNSIKSNKYSEDEMILKGKSIIDEIKRIMKYGK